MINKLDLNEEQTRKQKIDVSLKHSGWDLDNSDMVILEVDTKQSDFNKFKYKVKSETLSNDEDSGYADYLLLDGKSEPLAVIEAKRTSKDPIVGEKQARMYADDIFKQTKKHVFLYYTNGYEIWFWNYPYESPRMVSGYHSRDDLERIRSQNKIYSSTLNVGKINSNIIDRPYQIEAVKRVLEGINRGKRKFLIVQATGTGKTRVSMAIIDSLMNSGRVSKVLFLADRTALSNQAFNKGFSTFFPNVSKSKIVSKNLDKNSKLYVSTIQTFMECYKEFSPGEFDVIISDEAHRSIYNKWKEVFTYFDSITIGLTATPSESIDKDTFRFFECVEKQPSYVYTYEDAVKDNMLAKFKVHQAQTSLQNEGISIDNIPDFERKRLLEDGFDEADLNWSGDEVEKRVSALGTSEAMITEFMNNCICDDSGIPAKTIFFAISKRHAANIYKAFQKLYPQYKGNLVKIITSDDSRAQELLKEFENNSMPRIAISVDMLDTGVDVPEVCNLVFAKPVFSTIKFWQMIGRGTRHNSVCKNRDWLPNVKKDEFLIFDFWKNFEWHKLNPEGRIDSPNESLNTKIFKTKLETLRVLRESGDTYGAEHVRNRIIDDINCLDENSLSLRDGIRFVEKVKSSNFWDNTGIDQLDYLKTKITPLIKYRISPGLPTEQFINKCEKLYLAVVKGDVEQINILKVEICEYIECLPDSLDIVRDKSDIKQKVLSSKFWDNISIEDVEMLIKEFSPLMPYRRAEKKPFVVLDMDDSIKAREMIEYGSVDNPIREYVSVYKDKVEQKIKELALSDKTINKIERDEPINDIDIDNLVKTLNSPDLYINEQNLRKVYREKNGTIMQFIKKILGLIKQPNMEQTIQDEFKTYIMINNKSYNSNQINFLRVVMTVFMKRKHIEYSDFFEAPFTNFGTNSPIPLFTDEQLKDIVSFCDKLEDAVK